MAQKIRLLCALLTIFLSVPQAVQAKGASHARELFRQAFDLYQAGEFDDAVSLFAEGLKDDPQNAMAHFYLGETYSKLQKFKLAREHYAKSAELAPKSKEGVLSAARLKTPPKLPGALDGKWCLVKYVTWFETWSVEGQMIRHVHSQDGPYLSEIRVVSDSEFERTYREKKYGSNHREVYRISLDGDELTQISQHIGDYNTRVAEEDDNKVIYRRCP